MNIPRYKPVANDKFGIADDADGKLCEYRHYSRLKAEVERLKEGNECLDQMHEKEMARSAFLCEQVERLTKQIAGLIVSLQKSHDEHGEALYKLKYKNERKTSRKKRSS